jgi:hypothetical protein
MCFSAKQPKIRKPTPPPPPPRYPDRSAVEARLRGTSGMNRAAFGDTTGPKGAQGLSGDASLITSGILSAAASSPALK